MADALHRALKEASAEPVRASKRVLRSELRRRRAELPAARRARADRDIRAQVAGCSLWRAARRIFIYLSFGAEVDTWSLIEDAWRFDIVVLAPRCAPGTFELSWHEIEMRDSLERSPLGMLEPAIGEPVGVSSPEATRSDDLAIVPGLAFDRSGFRLGGGKGCYDRFLSAFRGSSIGLCRTESLLDGLAARGCLESHDRPVDIIATELGLIYATVARDDL